MEAIIQLTFKQLSGGIFSVVIFFGIIQWLLSVWIKSRLEKSIQHEYDKKLEDYKFSQLQRQKAELIALFFAKWIKFSGEEQYLLKNNELIEYYEDLNRMSLEISLWIKDEKLLNSIMSLFKKQKKNTEDLRTLTGKVRKLILNCDDFDSQNIILWPNQEIKDKLFKSVRNDEKILLKKK